MAILFPVRVEVAFSNQITVPYDKDAVNIKLGQFYIVEHFIDLCRVHALSFRCGGLPPFSRPVSVS